MNRPSKLIVLVSTLASYGSAYGSESMGFGRETIYGSASLAFPASQANPAHSALAIGQGTSVGLDMGVATLQHDSIESSQASIATATGSFRLNEHFGVAVKAGMSQANAEFDNKAEGDSYRVFGDSEQNSRAFEALIGTSFAQIDLGLSYFHHDVKSKFKNTLSPLPDSPALRIGEQQATFKENEDAKGGVATLSIAYNALQNLRIAAAYTPEQLHDKDMLVSAPERFALATSATAPGFDTARIGIGIERTLPVTDEDYETTASTEISSAVEVKIDRFTPRIGITNFATERSNAVVLALGTSVDFGEIALSGDIAASQRVEDREDKNRDRTMVYGMNLGLTTAI